MFLANEHEELNIRELKEMNTVISGLLVVAVMLSLFVQANPVSADSGDQKLERAVRKANSDWEAAVKTGDAAAIVAPYADDAVFILVDGTCIRGRAEIEKITGQDLRPGELRLRRESIRRSSSLMVIWHMSRATARSGECKRASCRKSGDDI